MPGAKSDNRSLLILMDGSLVIAVIKLPPNTDANVGRAVVAEGFRAAEEQGGEHAWVLARVKKLLPPDYMECIDYDCLDLDDDGSVQPPAVVLAARSQDAKLPNVVSGQFHKRKATTRRAPLGDAARMEEW